MIFAYDTVVQVVLQYDFSRVIDSRAHCRKLDQDINHCIVEAVEEHDTEAIDKLNQAIDKFMK